MPSHAKDLTGKPFHFLTVRVRVENRPEHHGQSSWECECACGKVVVVASASLRKGRTKSCGCKKLELNRVASTKHGRAAVGHPGRLEYRIWSEMKQRCENPKSNRYYTHGARGITVCDRWKDSFENFIADMGERSEKGLSLERRENDGNYEPSNCFWATKKQQARNKRNNRMVVVGEESRCAAEWSELTGIPAATIRSRLRAGWSPRMAVGKRLVSS